MKTWRAKNREKMRREKARSDAKELQVIARIRAIVEREVITPRRQSILDAVRSLVR